MGNVGPRPGVAPGHRCSAVGMTDDEYAALCRDGADTRARVPEKKYRCRSAPAEQRTAQSTQRREEQNPTHARAPGAALTRGVTRGQLTHQQGRLCRLSLRDGRTRQHREMAVEARTGRTASAGDRRNPRPATHYLFHVTPHPYESTRPGQTNPIAPSGHSCIAVAGFTFPVRVLTTLRSSLSESNRFQGELDNRLAGGLR